MGNRAIVKPASRNMGVYLHWNGGRDSVEPFLEYCKLKGFRSFEDDYGIARFCQVVGNFFGGGLSIGIQNNIYMCNECASGLDNGIYEVKGWEIVGRLGGPSIEQHSYDPVEMLLAIDASQPPKERLGKGYITSELVTADELRVGDRVYFTVMEDEVPKAEKIIGIGEMWKRVNGREVGGVPYIGKYGDVPSENVNNYLFPKNWKGEVQRYRRARRRGRKKQLPAAKVAFVDNVKIALLNRRKEE